MIIPPEYITKCKNKECEKKEDCIRFKIAKGTVIEFVNICNEESKHRWFWQIKREIVKKED